MLSKHQLTQQFYSQVIHSREMQTYGMCKVLDPRSQLSGPVLGILDKQSWSVFPISLKGSTILSVLQTSKVRLGGQVS